MSLSMPEFSGYPATYKGLLESKMSLSMPEFSGYPATWMNVMKQKIKFNLYSIFLTFETEMLVKFSLLYATTKV